MTDRSAGAMWLNPLPSEAVIGAIVGAVLSTVMAYYKYLEVNVWTDVRYALYFVVVILCYGVCLHFYCAAVLLSKHKIGLFFLVLCIVIYLVILIIQPKELTLTDSGQINFLPNPGSVLISGVLLIWLLILRTLTWVKLRTEGLS